MSKNFSSRNASSSNSQGLGVTSVLTIVFVVLKLTGTIDWSWWWVLSPLWIVGSLLAALFIFILILASLK